MKMELRFNLAQLYFFQLLWREAVPAWSARNSQLHLFRCWPSLLFSSRVNIYLETPIKLHFTNKKLDLSRLGIQQFDVPLLCVKLSPSHFSSVHEI